MTALLSGTFNATGASNPVMLKGPFNVSLSGTFTGSVTLQRSFDMGANWNNVSADGLGTTATYTAPAQMVFDEPEHGVLWRFNCTALSAGSVAYRFGA